MAAPTFFKSPAAFGAWLDRHAESAKEVVVGFYKVGTGKSNLSWSESVDEALCRGWIDAVRKRIDDETYQIRFTPRKPTSIWSAVNIAKFSTLSDQGRMKPAGVAAFAKRSDARSAIYSFEQAETAELKPDEKAQFTGNVPAWEYWRQTPPGYKKQMLHRVTTAKKAETRASRLAKLIALSAEGRRWL